MKEVIIPSDSVFIVHSCLQHTGGEWQGEYFLQYHMHLIREELELKDTIAFVHGNDLSIAVNTDKEVGDGNCPVVVKGATNDIRSDDGRHVRAVQFPMNRRELLLVFSISILHICLIHAYNL